MAVIAWVGAGCATASSGGTVDPPAVTLSVVSYNIRHGRGMDDQVDLERIAAVLRRLDPDVVALQEVDEGVDRSGGVDQTERLGDLLGMHHAFGSFMDYQGGRYGMSILSRCAMRFVTPVRLTEGNEPRIALAVELALRDGVVLTVINVHFDWVRDDNFRFTQAREVADYLEGVSGPWILLGDLNDQSGSRTLALFQEHAQEAMKPSDGRFTFPSIDPVREIDFVFVAPRDAWTVDSVHVVDETIASDHRPVFAGVTYGNPESGGTRWDCSGT